MSVVLYVLLLFSLLARHAVTSHDRDRDRDRAAATSAIELFLSFQSSAPVTDRWSLSSTGSILGDGEIKFGPRKCGAR